METKNQNQENKKLKKLEETELEVVLYDKDDILVTSGECKCNWPGSDGECCLAAGTAVTMADGTVKKIDDICEGDMILSFDHEAGCVVGNPVLFAYRGKAPKCAFTLRFANGTAVSVVGKHDLFEQESRKYVTITEENAGQFIGNHFYSADERGYVELVGVTREAEAVDYYEIYTAKTLNMIANGMLNVADDVDYTLNIYEFYEDLNINKEALARDIQKYGLFAFRRKLGYSTQEHEGFNLWYLNIAVGKGLVSWDSFFEVHFEYLRQRDEKRSSQCA